MLDSEAAKSFPKEIVRENTNPKVVHGKNGRVIVLVPQPSDDPEDPLNWPMRKKLVIFVTICLAGFAGQASPNSNQLTFILQAPTYHKTQNDLLYSVAAALAGFMAGPFLFVPFSAICGRSSVILWSLVAAMACQIWAAETTGVDGYISFVLSRLMCGLFGVLPAILGSGYIMDMFFLHQRGKVFAVFEITIIFAVIGSGTFGGFIAQTRPWPYVFWWTVGPLGAAIILVICFLQDTSFNRDPKAAGKGALPKPWAANRLATFCPGTQTVPQISLREFLHRVSIPFVITFTPTMLLVGTFVFVALGIPIMQASIQSIFLQTPVAVGGYSFSPLQNAFFTMNLWVGVIAAQVYGFLFNDKTPLWVARRRGGIWHSEYRLANTILPSILLPIGLGIYGAALQYHLHYMVLALAAFIIWFSALLALPVCYNYGIECFLHHPVEASVALNAYRLCFGLASSFFVLDWQAEVGVGWVFGMSAFFALFVALLMIMIIWKGHIVRRWNISQRIAATEDGVRISIKDE